MTPKEEVAQVRVWWEAKEWHRLIPVVSRWAQDAIKSRFTLSGDDSDDIVSRVIVKAWTAPDVPDSPRNWVVTVTANLVRDHAKAGWNARRTPSDSMDVFAGTFAADALIDDAEQRVRIGRLREALRRLPELLRRCLVLHDLHGRTCPDIAAQMETTEGAVKMRLVRARKMLAVLYEQTPDVTLDADNVPISKRGRPAVRSWREINMPAKTKAPSVAKLPREKRSSVPLDRNALGLRYLHGAY